MINNNNKILMTSIIAMTFLIGFTANEAYAGTFCVDSCEANFNNDISACEVSVVNAIDACGEGDNAALVLQVFSVDPFCFEVEWDNFCDNSYVALAGVPLSACGVTAVNNQNYNLCVITANEDFDMCLDACNPDLTIGKTLLDGHEEIGISLATTTTYKYTIEYTGPAALVIDTVPAEFEVLTAVSGDDDVTITNQGKGIKSQGATKIEWSVQAGTSTLIVDITTVESPGKGHKLTVFKPTSCGPLAINDGATAFEVDAEGNLVLVPVIDPDTQLPILDPDTGLPILVPVVLVGPSNSLEVEAVEGAKACIEVEDEEEIEIELE